MNKLIALLVLAVVVVGGSVLLAGQRNGAGFEASTINTIDNTMAEPTELMTEDVTVGTGLEATPGKNVTVHYVGTFKDGSKFDSSRDRGEPFEFLLGAGQVIAGWDQGVAGMKVGGVRKLTVPASLGYGPNDYGPIPGGSTLYFEVELLDVK